MALEDPFDGLKIDRDTVCRFFAVFSRLEYAMKQVVLYRKSVNGVAAADWFALGKAATAFWLQFTQEDDLGQAIDCLLNHPPEVQGFDLVWQSKNLDGNSSVAQAIMAVSRVRNNLFHGGKHHDEPYPGRDQALVEAALVLMTDIVERSPGDLRFFFNGG